MASSRSTSACSSTSSTRVLRSRRQRHCHTSARVRADSSIALPIGISFFTFEKISYVVDVYRGDVRGAPRTRSTSCSSCPLFPPPIAGPIVRLREIEDQLAVRRVAALDDVTDGATRFAHGLAKKVIIADSVAPVADAAFATRRRDLTTTAAWLGALAYTLQIYFDFSGYSDMAIGLARMFGFRFPENFNHPYSRGVDHRLLAALAHDAVALVPRLRLHPARRQSRQARWRDVPEPRRSSSAHRALARRRSGRS